MQMCLYDRPLERKVTGQVQFGLFCSCSQPGAHFLFKVMGVYFLLGYFAWNVLDSAVTSVVCWHVIRKLYLYHAALCMEEVDTNIHSVMRMLCFTMGGYRCFNQPFFYNGLFFLSSSFTSCLLWERCVICLIGIGCEWNWVHHVDADVFVMTAFFKSDLTGSGIRYTFWLCCAINLLVCFSMNTCESLVPTLMRDIFNKSLHSWVLFAVPLKCKLEM